MAEPLSLAVVGHTNVGKTSFLRTLLRSASFGEVSDRASTTRRVEGASLNVGGEPVLRLYDTPGLEEAMALLDHLERLQRPDERRDGPALVQRFLDGPEAAASFAQEARVLRQLVACDAGLYVIDAREPVLPKYLDELEVLAMCGKPLFAVLNFVTGPDTRVAAWRDGLARRGLHALLAFDSVAPPIDGERRLFEALALMLPDARPQLERLIAERRAQAEQRRKTALQLIAELLLDVAAVRREVPAEQAVAEQALEAMREEVRARERACVSDLLRLYGFPPGAALPAELPVEQGRWEDDLFHPEALKRLGVEVSGGAAAGAAAGLAVDLMVGGASLGAGALVGGVVGGTAQSGRALGARLLGRLRGRRLLSVDDAVVVLLALRQQHLVRALERRGHAAQSPLALEAPEDRAWQQQRLPVPLRKARAHPEWSLLNHGLRHDRAERQRQAGQLVAALDSEPGDAPEEGRRPRS